MEERKLGPDEVRLKIILEQAGRATLSAVEFRKWVLASLVLANSGAMIALFKADNSVGTELQSGLSFFAAGLMLAIGAGLFAFNYLDSKAKRLIDAAWNAIPTDDAERNRLLEEAHSFEHGIKSFDGWGFTLFLFASAFTFIAGCLAAAGELSSIMNWILH